MSQVSFRRISQVLEKIMCSMCNASLWQAEQMSHVSQENFLKL